MDYFIYEKIRLLLLIYSLYIFNFFLDIKFFLFYKILIFPIIIRVYFIYYKKKKKNFIWFLFSLRNIIKRNLEI
jgi:hypothetical protein